VIREPAPAKVNLALHVRRRRPDGYHELETLFAFARHGDHVTVAAAEANSFAISAPRSRGLERWQGRAENLVTRAADAFTSAFEVPSKHLIALTKRLPVASGIGGGSADAAATLRALARLHGIDPAEDRLFDVARGLGADVSACLLGRTALGTGRGDDLVPLDGLSGTPMLLVNPGVAVSTAAVFRRWDGKDRGPLGTGDLFARARKSRNDLELPARTEAPVIGTVLDRLAAAPGVRLARMSGSGATCLALFGEAAQMRAPAAAARRLGWWCLETELA